jgi:EmrB/QacA subfamily drug resistance transporter
MSPVQNAAPFMSTNRRPAQRGTHAAHHVVRHSTAAQADTVRIAGDRTDEAASGGPMWTILLSSVAVFLIALEITIISVALPDIEAAFPESSRATVSWIFTSYNIGVASLMLIAGWTAERIGRRRIFLLGLAVFTLGSVLSGVAPSMAVLLGGRVVQAIGGAMLLPASLALILHGVDDDRRDAAIGIWGAMAGLAAAIGPTAGALLIDVAGWRWVFLLNVPIGIAALVIAPRRLTESNDPDAPTSVDVLAPPLGALGVGAAVLAITAAGVRGASDPIVLGAAGAAVVLLAAFVTRTRRHSNPLFPVDVARLPSYRTGAIGTLFFGAGFAGWLVLAPTFLVTVHDYDVLGAGLAIAPAPIAMAITAGPAGKLCARFGYRRVITAGALLGVAAIATWLITLDEASSYVSGFLPGAILLGISVGIGFPMLTAASMRDVPEHRYAVAAAGNTTIRQVAIAIGISVAVAIVGAEAAAETTSELADFQASWIVCGVFFALTAAVMATSYRETASTTSSPADVSTTDTVTLPATSQETTA